MMLTRLSIGLVALLIGLSAHGEWRYWQDVDEFTDEVDHNAATEGETKDGRTLMAVGCMDGYWLGVLWDFLGHPRGRNWRGVDMRFRWDDEEIGQTKVDRKGGALMARSPGFAYLWARKAMERSKLRINFKDRRGSLVTATYN